MAWSVCNAVEFLDNLAANLIQGKCGQEKAEAI
jgi:hypothetical protein